MHLQLQKYQNFRLLIIQFLTAFMQDNLVDLKNHIEEIFWDEIIESLKPYQNSQVLIYAINLINKLVRSKKSQRKSMEASKIKEIIDIILQI